MPFKEESRRYLRTGKVKIAYKMVRVGLRAMEIFNQDLKEMKELGK